jgi:F-type H+/Na+-transporting ATPase subunit beta
VTEAFTGHAGRTVEIKDTLAGCRAILDGEVDELPESAFYLVGTLDDARVSHAAGGVRSRGASSVQQQRSAP